jgi:hypothetical protein
MEGRKRRRENPFKEAEYYVLASKDQEGLEKKWIDSEIGWFFFIF